MRGCFANVRLRNQLVPGVEGGFTRNLLSGEVSSVYDAAMAYRDGRSPADRGRRQGLRSGSSRDWAAKGPALLGVRAVLAESFERIHRSNMIGMGILPLQFMPGENAESLGLSGTESINITGLRPLNEGRVPKTVRVSADDLVFTMHVRLDTDRDADYYRHGGITKYVMRKLLDGPSQGHETA